MADGKEPQIVRVDIESLPQALALIRHELANLLRREAAIEAYPPTAKKLRTLAKAFEAGLGPVNESIWKG